MVRGVLVDHLRGVTDILAISLPRVLIFSWKTEKKNK